MILASLFVYENLSAEEKPKSLNKSEDNNVISNSYLIDITKIDDKEKKNSSLLSELKLPKDLEIKGKFHFFNSHTNEDFRENKNLKSLMQGDGRIDFRYEKKFDNSSVYTFFQVKKKYDNDTKLLSSIGIKSNKYGDFKIASFNPIFDEFNDPYRIVVGSSGAWLRNINTSFAHGEGVSSPIINDIDSVMGFYTDHDLTSIMYKTSSFKGFDLGISYTNDTKTKKEMKRNFPYKNVVSIVGNYNKELSESLKFGLSIMTEIGSSYNIDLNNDGFINDETIDDLRSLMIGGTVDYNKLQFALMYANFFKTNRLSKIPVIKKNSSFLKFNSDLSVDSKGTQYISGAISYKFTDRLKASFYTFYSENGQDYAAIKPATPSTNGQTGQIKFLSNTIAASYEVYKNSFAPYVEISRFTVKDNDSTILSDKQKDNNGYVFVIGAKALF
jgi:predicted porin